MDLKSKYKKIDREQVRKFLDTHRDKEFSVAKLEYSLYLEPEMSKQIIEYVNSRFKKTENDLEIEKTITETSNPDELLKLMRKKLSGFNRSLLREKIMEYEREMLPVIKEKCIRNKQDIFIENALYFFVNSKENCCDWIIEMYEHFQSEYLKSMFCLILGFRGEEWMIPLKLNTLLAGRVVE